MIDPIHDDDLDLYALVERFFRETFSTDNALITEAVRRMLDAGGKLIYSQKNGEFENARSLAPDDVIAFLNKWKPAPRT